MVNKMGNIWMIRLIEEEFLKLKKTDNFILFKLKNITFENKENDKAEGFSEEYMQKLAAIASSASEFTDEELDEMWKRVMNRAMETKPSLFVALQGSALLHLSEKDIRVSLRADYALAIIEPDRELIADLIEEESGIHGFVNFKVVSQTQETSEENASDVAREIKDEWGFDVKIR